MIKGIIFDMGGPLLQTRPDYEFDKVTEVAENLMMRFQHDDEFIAALKTDEITKEYSCDEVARKVVSKYCKISAIWDVLLPKLKEKYKLAVINNGSATTIPYFKEKYNFSDFFEVFINSAEVGFSKPDAKIYEITLGKLGLKPEECIFIDDNLDNIKGAEKVGIKSIQFTSYEKLADELKKLEIII